MLHTAFIGAGPRSQNAHYPNVNRLADVEMMAVCELDEERLHQVAVEYDFQYRYSDHRQMLEEIDPDLVYCVMHERWLLQPALDCLNAGKHIFIEKPPGMNMEEVQQIHDAAVANNVFAVVGFQRRYAAVTQEALRHVEQLGPVSTAVGTFHKRLLGEKARSFTTTLWEDICHVVDLVRYMADGEALEVSAYQDRFGSDYRNCYTALIRFDNGATGIIHGNRASGGRVLRSELHGVGVGCYMKIPAEIEIHADDQARVMGGWQVDGVDRADVSRYDGVLTMHEHIAECVRSGQTPLTDIRDAIQSMAIVAQMEGVTAVASD